MGAEALAEAVAEAFATSIVLFSPVTSVTAYPTDLILSFTRVSLRGQVCFAESPRGGRPKQTSSGRSPASDWHDQTSSRLRAACGRPGETYFVSNTWVSDQNRSVWTTVLRVGVKKRAVGYAVTEVGGGLRDLGGFVRLPGSAQGPKPKFPTRWRSLV